METKIKDFCDKYTEKKKYDSNPNSQVYVGFNVCSYTSSNLFRVDTEKLITLDQEDIDYLYKKYSAKLEAELLANIEDLKEQYKKL